MSISDDQQEDMPVVQNRRISDRAISEQLQKLFEEMQTVLGAFHKLSAKIDFIIFLSSLGIGSLLGVAATLLFLK